MQHGSFDNRTNEAKETEFDMYKHRNQVLERRIVELEQQVSRLDDQVAMLAEDLMDRDRQEMREQDEARCGFRLMGGGA